MATIALHYRPFATTTPSLEHSQSSPATRFKPSGSNLPDCRSKDDNFTLMNGDFTPGTFEVDDNSSLSFSDCMVRCWNDCHCLAFDSRDNGVGCNIWTGTESANFVVNPQGTLVRKYVLLSPTPSKGKDAKIVIWAPVVAGIFLLLLCLGLL